MNATCGTPELSIVIVNWNSVSYLRECVSSVQQNLAGISYEIIVVDAGSYDGSDEMLAASFPSVRYIQMGRNLGFAKSNNVGFQSSHGEIIFFLNPDTVIIGDAIQRMVAAIRAVRDAGTLGCKLLNRDGTIQTSCVQAFPTIWNQLLDCEFLRGLFPSSGLWGTAALFKVPTQAYQIAAISGAAVMIKRDVFEGVQGFTEDYFMYCEDMDLSYKTHKAGLKNLYEPRASIVHFGGGSSDKAVSQFAAVHGRKALFQYFVRFKGKAYAHLFRLSVFLVATVRLLLLAAPGVIHMGARASIPKWSAIWKWALRGA